MNSVTGPGFVIAQATGGQDSTTQELIRSEDVEISEALGVEEHGEGGMPQFDFSNYAPQVVWLVITFIALYLLMSRIALPRIATVIEHRRDRIASDLDAAARLKEETDEVIAAYEAELAEARGRAHEIAADTREKLNAELGAERAEVEAGLAEKTAEAEKRIAEMKAAALAEVDSAAADAAGEIVTTLTGLKPTRAEIDEAVASARSS
ncbi:F0F1 ATP synthase subunit B [Microbaculum marinum]|uniref:ATP synthase subunit b n=1 Tax=Microbaculum marinum TaxID=1764581 RepID=A0AAW9RW40_9HYPH